MCYLPVLHYRMAAKRWGTQGLTNKTGHSIINPSGGFLGLTQGVRPGGQACKTSREVIRCLNISCFLLRQSRSSSAPKSSEIFSQTFICHLNPCHHLSGLRGGLKRRSNWFKLFNQVQHPHYYSLYITSSSRYFSRNLSPSFISFKTHN